MKNNKLQGGLKIKSLELKVNLGWRDKEQLEPQAILLDIDIYFNEPPVATKTDNLEDTICYATLIEKIRAHIATKKYRLVEHLAQEIYDVVHQELPEAAKGFVTVSKKPLIDGLNGGVSFSIF